MNNCMEKEIIKYIGENRYLHSLRVMEIALKLGEIHDVNKEKLEIASILHDCGKIQDKTQLLKTANNFGIILDTYMRDNKELIHGPLGAKIAEVKFKVTDKEILNAIKYHTTGRENMTLFDKIIFIADYIEPSRNFQGIEEVRKMAYEDLDKSIIMAMDKTINFLIDNQILIHTRTVEARNYLIINIMKKEVFG